ncbi:hypothetical protein ACVMIX_002912 [Rhizobium leguminosarum]
MQLDAGDAADQVVGAPGGDLAQEQAVLAVLAPADQEVEFTPFQLGDHRRNVLRVVLEVAVHRRDQAALGRVDAGLHGCGLTEVALQLDDPER